jgi:large subunit ribosomal protein L21
MKLAVIKAGGKQYLVKENDEIVVEKIGLAKDADVELEALAVFDDAGTKVELGSPSLKTLVKAKVIEEGKGDKIRVARFKAKVRYRKVRGFRPQLTKIKILSI